MNTRAIFTPPFCWRSPDRPLSATDNQDDESPRSRSGTSGCGGNKCGRRQINAAGRGIEGAGSSPETSRHLIDDGKLRRASPCNDRQQAIAAGRDEEQLARDVPNNGIRSLADLQGREFGAVRS